MLVRWSNCDVATMANNIAKELKSWIAGTDQYDDLTFVW